MMSDRNFFAELKRRNVYKVAVAYAVVSWLLIQIATQVFPFFEIPNWAVRLVVIVLILGFPIALVLSWAFEITPEGIKRESEVAPDQSIAHHTGRKLVGLTITLAIISVGLLAWQLLGHSRAQPVGEAASFPTKQDGKRTASPTKEDLTDVRASAPIPEKSIAVLPFENFSDEKQNAFFADGVQDEILTDLSKIADLKVISRTSVLQYKDTSKRNLPEIAQALKVAHVLEGSVQRAANRVRVTAQLIDARTDAHLWAQRFDGDLSDVFAIQAEIAQKIADQLQAVLSPKEKTAIAAQPTKDLAAYDLYLRAREMGRSSFSVARPILEGQIHLLEDATRRDPAFVPALCLLARSYLELYWFNFDHSTARLEQGRKAIDAAASVQPDAGEVHLARAFLLYHGNRDYVPALAELDLAHRAMPNDGQVLYATAIIERRQGQWSESNRHMQQSLTLDPQNRGVIFELTTNYEALNQYSEAAGLCDEALRSWPNDFVFLVTRAGIDRDCCADLSYLQKVLANPPANADDSDFVAESRTLLALDQRDFSAAKKALADSKRPDLGSAGFIVPREATEGEIALGLGDSAGAQSAFRVARQRAETVVIAQPENAKALIVLAQIDAVMRRNEDAVREGGRAVKMLPVKKDALDGPRILRDLAGIYARVGQKDHAMDLLEQVAPMTNGPSYGDLKLQDDWDSLRGNARFEKIVASLAPKNLVGPNK